MRIGTYEVVRELGEGGFATTYEARHALLGTRACLKVCRQASDEDLMLEEARILWDLHHPSLPTLRDVLRDPAGRLTLVMRFVEGQSLEAATPIDLATAVQVLGRLLRALRVLHHRGIVHNDVKPANIVLEPDRHGVVLVDFGVSTVRPRASSSAPGFSDVFAAPEVVEGRPPLPESDLYSLGLSVLSALGGDPESRVLPEGISEPFLELLVALTRRSPERRPRWGHEDPLRWLDRLMPALPPARSRYSSE